MTKIYFIRHAESDFNIRDEAIRPLTEKGMRDREAVTEYLEGDRIDAVLSSPYKRAVDTVAHFADKYGYTIELIEDFRERKVGSEWVEDFYAYTKRQWDDFDYATPEGECLRSVQTRNINALKEVLTRYEGKTIVIGTHGTALSMILNHYDPSYNHDNFMSMAKIMPWIVQMGFDGRKCIEMIYGV